MKSNRGCRFSQISSLLAVPLLIVFVATGCVTALVAERTTPDISDFPDAQLLFTVGESPEVVRLDALSRLSARGLPARQEIKDRFTYVITTYFQEPAPATDRRLVRAAYMIRIAGEKDQDRVACSNVAVGWRVESRGVREESWRVTEADKSYKPSRLEEMTNWFRNRKECK